MDEVKLPQGWALTTIGKICTKLQYGYTATASVERCGPRFLRITDIQDGAVAWPTVPYCEIDSKQAEKYLVCDGDIVFARTGGTVGKSYVINSVPEPSVFASYLIRLSAHAEVDPNYLYYFFQSPSYWEQIGLKKGGLQGNVNATSLASLAVPICSLNEQRRIVVKIEELFSELDKGIESLKIAQAQLKVYRQALFKNAFEGKLTAHWRMANPEKLKASNALLIDTQQERTQRYHHELAEWQASGKQGLKPRIPKALPAVTVDELAGLPELPTGWTWTRLGNTNSDVFDGPFGSNLKSSDYVADGVRVIRLENIGALEFIENKESYITQEKYELLKGHTVSGGDIIFSSFITENIRVALLPKGITKAVNKADCFCVRSFGQTLNTEYLVTFLSTRHVFKQLEAKIHGVGRPRINTTQLKDVFIPICSPDEQLAVISEIDSRLSQAAQLEQTLSSALLRSEALRGSILIKAFRGQLVPQHPTDEPASALLTRINAESSAKLPGKKARK